MRSVREEIGGLGNLMFKEAFIWAQMRKGVISDVYAQGEKYWKPFADEIRMRYGQGIGNIDRVALHIRRGDYLKVSQFHTNLWDTDYYKKAVSFFPNEKFLVFCKDNQNPEQDADDKRWCEKNIPYLDVDFELYPHATETEDLNAMASCKAIIMANSSFSWWAAYLGDPFKKVICPSKERWFVDGAERIELLDRWEQV